MLSIWTKSSGYKFQDIYENEFIELSLPINFENGFNDSTNLSFKIISGIFPPGLRLKDFKIQGTAREVTRTTEFKFVIRAQLGTDISDRTFFMNVIGSDDPEWQTKSGTLQVGNPGQFFVLDSSFIDFQLEATDEDTAAGQILTYNIISGLLPPGLILTTDGRITGFIEPALSIPPKDAGGAYGTTIYDYLGYDFGERVGEGYDSFLFESTRYDYSIPGLTPKKINRYYEFVVMVTDGDSKLNRTFKIYVVGDDHFHADSSVIKVGSGTFSADASFVRAPIWVTPKNLGIKRASNYHTYKLDIYDDKNLSPVAYELDKLNPRLKAIAYTTSILENKINTNKIRITEVDKVPTTSDKVYLKYYIERYIIPENSGDPIEVIQADDTLYSISNVQTISDTEYVLTIYPNLNISITNGTAIGIGSLSELPPGMSFDVGSAEVYGVVPYQANITQTYNFTAIAYRSDYQGDHIETARSRRTFTITILGTVDNIISWITDRNLGQLPANIPSNLFVEAITTIPNTSIIYNIKSGSLPAGLSLTYDGQITGKVNQYGSSSKPGLTVLDDTETTFDDASTTIDKTYRFTITARDIVNYDSVDKEFILEITTPKEELYSNIIARPFMKIDQRNKFKSFVNNSDIFVPEYIYRPNDPYFGVQQDIKMIIYAGIETKPASIIASAMLRNHKRKRFLMGELLSAQAKLPGTNTIVYEVIYIKIIDPLEHDNKFLPNIIRTSKENRAVTVDQTNEFYQGPFDNTNPYWSRPDPFNVTIDNNFVFSGDGFTEFKFPSSISRWRQILKTIGLRDRTYLPLWMRTVQDGNFVELDYQLAAPICYCKPGKSQDILLNIKNYIGNTGFTFTQFDIEIDRYIIDSVTGDSTDKYLVFNNHRTSIS